MQVFLPYSNLAMLVQCFYKDKRRYNKQIIECKQIIAAIEGTSMAWRNHPVVYQYRNRVQWLKYYMQVLEAYKIGGIKYVTNLLLDQRLLDKIKEVEPDFVHDQEYLDVHKRRLYQKNPKVFPEFAPYDSWNMSNWYCVPLDFEIPNRRNVKLVKECSTYRVVAYFPNNY